MPRGGYSPLPGSQELQYSAAEDEMERAFESDEEDQDAAHLTQPSRPPMPTVETAGQSQEGTYDFEREYDHPPPGSPPASSPAPIALGNSNGVIPAPSAILRQELGSHGTKPSFFRRAVGALLPQHYARVPTSEAEIRGSGIENDGVFSNVSARPSPPRTVRDDNGNVHVMPEEAQSDVPPSYAAAQADSAPPYWETTVHAPACGGVDDLLIDGLPAGTIFSFAWNFLISISFQFVGFMLTYLLHTSHAAKYGSRAGLGVTLIQYGLFSKASSDSDIFGDGTDGETGVTTLSGQTTRLARRGLQSLSPRLWMTTSDDQDSRAVMMSNGVMHDWISFILMTIGWILLLSSILGFARVKRWERSIRTPTPAPTISPEAMERDEEVRSHLREVFGFDLVTVEEAQERPMAVDDLSNGTNTANISTHEERMRHDLRVMGLI